MKLNKKIEPINKRNTKLDKQSEDQLSINDSIDGLSAIEHGTDDDFQLWRFVSLLK